MNTEKAKQFILKTARPVERAEFLYHFYNGPKEAVVEALRPYQNPDGGFGHGLEADNWNPASTPVTTNTALEILFRTGALEAAPDMLHAMAGYLRSSVDEERGRWPFAIDSNKNHPHAVWWEKNGEEITGWNPTVSLAAFLVCMGEISFRDTVKKAFGELEQKKGGDELKCYILAYGLLQKYGIKDVIDLGSSRQSICSAVQEAVCRDISKYGVEYVTTPSCFDRAFLPEILLPQVQAELALLDKLQKEDGGFDISWQWYTPYTEEFALARVWWRPRVTMEKLLFLQAWAPQPLYGACPQ